MLLVGVVFANHLFPRTYTGTLGGALGGTVTFRTSADGQRVTSFTLDPTGTCRARTFFNAPISLAGNHTFTGTSTVSTVSGSFSAGGTASGTLTSLPAGTACDLNGVTWSAAAQATPTPSPSATPVPTITPIPTATPFRTPFSGAGSKLPNNGAPTMAIGLSGLSLLEIGYGLRLLSKKFQVRMSQVPTRLLRKMRRALRRGQTVVDLGDGIYMVHRSSGSDAGESD